MKTDGGYGVAGNISLNLILQDLSEEERKEWEKELLEEDEKAYQEFKEWQKEFNE